MYTFENVKETFENGSLKEALQKLHIFSIKHNLSFAEKWARLELNGYTECLLDGDDTLPWWRNREVVWIDNNNKVVGTEYDPERDQSWVYFGIKDIDSQNKRGLPEGEFRIPPPEGQENSIQFGMVQIELFYEDIRNAGLYLLSDVHEIIESRIPTEETFESKINIMGFKNFIERQAHADIFVDGNPQENIARALLQAYMCERSYREIPVRGGQTDIIVFAKEGRYLYETKIWRGQEYFQQGLREIEEYVTGENDDSQLKKIFYVVFDPTKSRNAKKYTEETTIIADINSVQMEVIIVDIVPPQPSKKKE